jgi:hypothetical protein
METLTQIETRHKAVLKTVDQVISILAPIHTGKGKYDCLNFNPSNIERLANVTDYLSSQFCKVRIDKPELKLNHNGVACSSRPIEESYQINIIGENFGFSFIPAMCCDVKKGIEKSFKAVESFTKKAIKERVQIEKIQQPKAKVNLVDKMSKKTACHTNTITKNDYICDIIDEMKTVNFQMEGRYIDQIKAGTKIEDYRSISPVNAKKLCQHIDKKDLGPEDHYVTHFKEIWRVRKDITHVRFFNGYKSDRKELLIELKDLQVNTYLKFLPEGMKPGTSCFTLFLGQIVVSKNFSDDTK